MPFFGNSRVLYALATVAIVASSGCSKSNSSKQPFSFVASAPAPAPPQWVKEIPPTPDWWTNIVVDYNENDSDLNKWLKIKRMETNIQTMVRKGQVPTKERRELVKYLTAFSKSTNVLERHSLKFEIGLIYEALGDHKWAIKNYADLASDSPDDPDEGTLNYLAHEYELVGERPAAIELFNYMSKSFTNSLGGEYGLIGLACLTGTNSNCVLEKPDWWAKYQNLPDWWSNVKVDMPQFTCWLDEFDFFASSIRKKTDKQETIKACALISKFRPVTCNQWESSMLMLCHAYSDAGDHYRAIETAWQIPEEFPQDPLETIVALKFIASEFDKLGDSKNAAKIRDDISCFKAEAKYAGLTNW